MPPVHTPAQAALSGGGDRGVSLLAWGGPRVGASEWLRFGLSTAFFVGMRLF